ncbi:MAG: PD-(D/E)XK nuclease family protein [Clostridia bacterium]|nr:PD-(D/E)XK nuclease family protein [Clostridia bacterium]
MTEFISGGAGAGKGSAVIDRIKARLGSGKRMFLIVPEQEAVIWEARVCRELPPSAALELEVVNFKRLADTVFRSVGGLNTVYTGEAKKILLMWSALLSVHDELSPARRDAGHEEKYVSLLLDTLKELKQNGITPASLDEASSSLDRDEKGELARKTEDLSLIFSAYRALEESFGTEDPDNILDMLAKVLRTHDFFKGCDVFIDSFYSLTPVETEILYYIMRGADDVVVTFTLDEDSTGPHFDHVKKFYKTAYSLASRCSRTVTKTTLAENLRCKNTDLLYIGKNLWDFSAPALPERAENVSVITCRDRYDEARTVGAVIEKLVYEGASYSDIAVVTGDAESFRGTLDVRLDALGIPYHFSKRTYLAVSPAVTLVTALLDVAAKDFRRETVVRCLKTGLCPVTERECANFEKYAATWNIRGRRRYLDGKAWDMNPLGYDNTRTEWGDVCLGDANRVKEAMSDSFAKLSYLFAEGDAPVCEIISVLYSILTDLGVYEKLSEDAQRLALRGKGDEAERVLNSYSAIIGAMDAMNDVVPDVRISADCASRLFFEVVSSFDSGAIPATIDMVTLGSARGIRCAGVKHVILAGCVEGSFPANPRSSGFFSDTDVAALESAGIKVSDNLKERTGEELFHFWRCFSLASDSVTLTAPSSIDGEECELSVGARQVSRISKVAAESSAQFFKRCGIFSVAGAKDASFGFADKATIDAVKRLAKEMPELSTRVPSDGALSAERDSVGAETAKACAGNCLSLTQSRIDCFTDCPFKYYMRYVLKLSEETRAALSSLNVGTFVHYVLEKFFRNTEGREYPLKDAETERIVDDLTAQYLEEFAHGSELSSRQKYLFLRIRRNVLSTLRVIMEEFKNTKFRPFRYELQMGSGEGSPSPLEFTSKDGTKIKIYGTIDRLDVYKKDGRVYTRVVDYKTGDKIFRLSDVEKAQNLQLLIYLFTVWKDKESAFSKDLSASGEVLPAAMTYLSAAPDKAKSSVPVSAEEAIALASSTVYRSGVVLDDPEVLSALGAPDEKYVPKNTPRLSLERFEELSREVSDVISSVGDSILEGNCGSVPSDCSGHDPCEYCAMKPICRHTGKGGDVDE